MGSQICFVPHNHDPCTLCCVVAQILQPAWQALKAGALGDIKHQQRTCCIAIVGICYGTVLFLPGSVPDLCLDRPAIDLQSDHRKIHTNGVDGAKSKLVASETI